MGVFNNFSKAGDNLVKAEYILAKNSTGAAVSKGVPGAYQPSTGEIVAISTALIGNSYQIVIALDGIASGSTGRWATQGEVYALVDSGVSANDMVMPDTSATGGVKLIAWATDTKAANKSCGQAIEAGADTTLTKILFGGRAYSAVT
jgi:hypothetical protein